MRRARSRHAFSPIGGRLLLAHAVGGGGAAAADGALGAPHAAPALDSRASQWQCAA